MKTLQLSFDTAKQLYSTASTEFKTMLEETFTKAKLCPNPIERLKTIEDCFAETGFSQKEFDEKYKMLPTAVKAFAIMSEIIVPALNATWEPDYSNSSEYKYYPFFDLSAGGFSFDGCSCATARTYVGARLVFKSKELAEYAGKQFIDVYKQFMTI